MQWGRHTAITQGTSCILHLTETDSKHAAAMHDVCLQTQLNLQRVAGSMKQELF